MKDKLIVLLSILALAISTQAQSHQQKSATETSTIDQTSITGTWKGELHDQPAVEVHLRNDAGKLTGVAIFYAIKGVGDEPPPGEKTEVTLIEPALTGRILSFKFRRPDGAIEKMQMKFINEAEAIMRPSDDPGVSEDMMIKMAKAR
jgi:hypothetical protein